MDIATGIGLIGGIATVVVLILIDGGNFAEVVRKNGPMALENVQVDDSFLARSPRQAA